MRIFDELAEGFMVAIKIWIPALKMFAASAVMALAMCLSGGMAIKAANEFEWVQLVPMALVGQGLMFAGALLLLTASVRAWWLVLKAS